MLCKRKRGRGLGLLHSTSGKKRSGESVRPAGADGASLRQTVRAGRARPAGAAKEQDAEPMIGLPRAVQELLADLDLAQYAKKLDAYGLDSMERLASGAPEDFEACGVKPLHMTLIKKEAAQRRLVDQQATDTGTASPALHPHLPGFQGLSRLTTLPSRAPHQNTTQAS